MGKMPKAARGIQYGDVSNAAVRNILTVLSDELYSKITFQELEKARAFFEDKCPYTGKDLKDAIERRTGQAQCDHIASQNKVGCGLNIQGNLVYVDRTANQKKGDISFEDFIRNHPIVPGTAEEKEKRIQKIKEWQKLCGYDPGLLEAELSARLQEIYDQVRRQQEAYIKELREKVAHLVPPKSVAPGGTKAGSKETGKHLTYTRSQKLALAQDYLFHGTAYETLEEKHLGSKHSGSTAQSILRQLGIEKKGEKQQNKGRFQGKTLEDAIAAANEDLGRILEEMKSL